MKQENPPKAYEPKVCEERWSKYWEEQKTFTPDPAEDGPAYSIVIPPPNITGALHIGHALNITLQDILCRYKRQKGFVVLWVPGADHAGIATQNVVERRLLAEGLSRRELGREAFLRRVWDWKDEYSQRIDNQIRRLGASVDWTRRRFTMDEGLSKAVREVFVRLFKEGLIYKGDYIINWCTRCHTALADDEVEHQEKNGLLYHLRYQLEGEDRHVVVATTRPETMLGDTAVAVHPEDGRYQDLIGRKVILPLVGRRIPIIADPYVDREFGTGCLKVTPAHDMNDFELGRRHNLETVQVIDDNGIMNENAGKYRGQDLNACREAIAVDLRAGGFLVREENYAHKVGQCYRCHTVIEPYISTQWFVAVKSLAARARAAVPERTEIFPASWTKTYYNWLDNIRDWCISRQLWWGHRIPAWTCGDCGQLIVELDDPQECPRCGGTALAREEDVLDTWFSSALWPFSTLGWPERTAELARFYPTSILITGFDIIFFWVARMMMMGLHFMDEAPFRHVYIHALVRDAEGRKMSKSTGNVIDPLLMSDKYGTDSLRFTLAAFAAMGRDIKLSEERIEGYRHFINKIWNAARFTMLNMPEDFQLPQGESLDRELARAAKTSLAQAFMLHRLEELKSEVENSIEEYRFNDTAQGLYQFIWHEFCDWYLEMLKPELSGQEAQSVQRARTCLLTILKEILILLHPIMPFVTQEIWSFLPGNEAEEKNLAARPFPPKRPELLNSRAMEEFSLLRDLIISLRNIKAELNIAPGTRLDVLVRTDNERIGRILFDNFDVLSFLGRVNELKAGPEISQPRGAAMAVIQGNQMFVPLAGVVDFEAESRRLEKEIAKKEKELEQIRKKLDNPNFVNKAPAEVVEKEQEKVSQVTDALLKIRALAETMRQY